MEATCIVYIVHLDAMKVIKSVTIHATIMDDFCYRSILKEILNNLVDHRAKCAPKIYEIDIQ